jgi:hypothetical protein
VLNNPKLDVETDIRKLGFYVFYSLFACSELREKNSKTSSSVLYLSLIS